MDSNNIAAALADEKYMSYDQELKGRKALKGNLSHPSDIGITSVVKTKDGQQYYDSKPLGVALFGLGRIGTIHFENLIRNPRVKLEYCVDPREERVNFIQYKWRLPKESVITSMEEADRIFEDKRVDCVVVCTPTYTHEELVAKALNAGKAVLCEKPIASTYEGIARCYELARKKKIPLLCAFNRRFDPGMKSVKKKAENGEVGKIQVVKTCSRDSPLPSLDYLKTSGGIFHDCAIHDIDVICWMLDEYPVSVSAQAHAFVSGIRGIDDFDTVGILFKFKSGAIGLIDLSRFSVYGYDQRLEVFGPKGTLICGDFHPNPLNCYNEKGTTTVPIFYSFASRYAEAYTAEMEHFINVVQGFDKLCVTEERTLAVIRIASACEESARSGKVIELKWD